MMFKTIHAYREVGTYRKIKLSGIKQGLIDVWATRETSVASEHLHAAHFYQAVKLLLPRMQVIQYGPLSVPYALRSLYFAIVSFYILLFLTHSSMLQFMLPLCVISTLEGLGYGQLNRPISFPYFASFSSRASKKTGKSRSKIRGDAENALLPPSLRHESMRKNQFVNLW